MESSLPTFLLQTSAVQEYLSDSTQPYLWNSSARAEDSQERICQQHIATYLKSCNECMKKNSIIQRNLRIINLLLAEVVERKQHVLS